MHRYTLLFILSSGVFSACGDTPQQAAPASEQVSKESAAPEPKSVPESDTPATTLIDDANATAANEATSEKQLEEMDRELAEELGAPKPDPNLPEGHKPEYATSAQALVDAIKADVPADVIEDMASDLVVTGSGVMNALKPLHPTCADYFTAIEAVAFTLKDLSISDIESGYHADGKLPKNDNPFCYHVKDLIVHPATVAAIAKTKFKEPNTREKAIGEITEVLQHYTEVAPKPSAP